MQIYDKETAFIQCVAAGEVKLDEVLCRLFILESVSKQLKSKLKGNITASSINFIIKFKLFFVYEKLKHYETFK